MTNTNPNSEQWEDILEQLNNKDPAPSDWEYRRAFVKTIRNERSQGMRFTVLRD